MSNDVETQETIPTDTADVNDTAGSQNGIDETPDDDFDFTGLTAEEIEAINSSESDDEPVQSDDTATVDDTNSNIDSDSDAKDINDTAEPVPSSQDQEDWQKEAESIAERRKAIDSQFDEKLNELEELGKQYDNGDILDGAYNAKRIRIEREIDKLKASELELVSKENQIEQRQQSEQEEQQQAFVQAVGEFMSRPENSVFVEGSPAFAALDQQLSVIASNMPPDTPYDVLLNKARVAVSAYIDLPEPSNAGKQDSKSEPVQDKQSDGNKGKPTEQQIMPSISNMPAVVANSTGDGKFAHLDKLSGPELERALADMPADLQNEYLLQ